MKQYTTPEQTAKLIELGFEKPKSIEKVTYIEQYGCGYETAYSIGELIEMLDYDLYSMRYSGMSWEAKGEQVEGEQVVVINKELIDALYDMVIKLKEEGVI